MHPVPVAEPVGERDEYDVVHDSVDGIATGKCCRVSIARHVSQGPQVSRLLDAMLQCRAAGGRNRHAAQCVAAPLIPSCVVFPSLREDARAVDEDVDPCGAAARGAVVSDRVERRLDDIDVVTDGRSRTKRIAVQWPDRCVAGIAATDSITPDGPSPLRAQHL